MRTFLLWIARGGIAAALIIMIVSIWPTKVIEHAQEFELNTPEVTQATIRFRSPEKMLRGARADFSVYLDLESVPAVDETVHPVMVYRLELDGAEIVPEAVFQIPLAGVQHQEVEWRVRLPRSGDFDGTWWVYVEYVGTGGQIIDQQAVFARRFTTTSQDIFGMSVNTARWAGIIVLLLGLGGEVWNSLHSK